MTTHQESSVSLASTVRSGQPTIGTFVSLGSPLATEVCAMAGFDWLLVDLEHGSGTEADLPGQIQAAALHNVPVVVRTETCERIRAGRALDMGASGVMLPRIDTAEQARQAVTDLRYPPAGRRGVANYNRSRSFGLDTRELADVDEGVLTVVQIETLPAMRNLDEIATTGADVFFVGPGDLTAAMGIYGQFDSALLDEALTQILTAARNKGIAAGILAANLDAAHRYIEQGFTFVAVGSEATLLLAAARSVTTALHQHR
ncbi:HpcH/HpaI aldolase/citrate lyase family protein [Mycolicibacterium sp. HK-90]|uniref:HpcH/HpaI aldolase family protein n=1 Tax=Mycolicibacterium sp. HK-90 TaxID=3056937 RepID=UPI002658333E|nr:aldolase/citrate lyase family protein [Mycolicibacterium sp. HK-90]WKG03958.1 aldolase/citrate lyase family protein [Mycolicibacterium sp. HK-90]